MIAKKRNKIDAAFRLACRSPHCRCDGVICKTAQAPLAAERRSSLLKQRQVNNLITFPKAADRRQLTSIQLESDTAWWKDQSGIAAESCNSETASDDHAAKRPYDEQQASLKPALVLLDIIDTQHGWDKKVICLRGVGD